MTNLDLSWTGPAMAPFIRADVARETDVQAMADVRKAYGRIDILVNNAGVNAYFDAEVMTEAEWESVFSVDLKGAWLCQARTGRHEGAPLRLHRQHRVHPCVGQQWPGCFRMRPPSLVWWA